MVGSGAAGSVVAARLAAGHRSVLLIEAGPDLRADTPPELHDGWDLNRDYYWRIESEPDEQGASQTIPRCRLVGGTSWMTRFAVRGSPADFGEWEALGNPEWGWGDVLPYFSRLESDADFGEEPWHGSSGPIPVNRYLATEVTDVHQTMVDAIEAAGIGALADHNRPGAVGVGRMPMSSRDGRRVSAADAYLPWGGTPPNLTIRPDTLVARIEFEGNRAKGVQLADGSVIEAGWVVVSAGVFGSPAVLMRSGIGPGGHLRSLDIDLVVDPPGVGEGLGDHPGTDLNCGHQGVGRSAPILHSIATFHSEAASSSDPPDLMLWVSDPEAQSEVAELFIDVVLLKPESRDSVRLRSADPTE